MPEGDEPERVAFDWSQAPGRGPHRRPRCKAGEAKPAALAATEVFVYIQNDEVRVEILMPLATLESWQPVPRANREFLEVAEQAAARPALETWLTVQNEVTIDGIIVKPKLGRLDFFGTRFSRIGRTA